MIEHAHQPKLCAECETVAHALAETGPPDDRVIKRCWHDPAGVVIGVAAKRGGQIVNWHVEGPMSESQADVVGAAIVATMVRSGMKVHEITKQ
jgi:hypothetical protein